MADTPSDEISKQIGQRIRATRLIKGLTQKQLGAMLGISFQQVQKYEQGIVHVLCCRLYQISIALETAPGAFFPSNGGGESTNVNGVVNSDELTALLDRPDTMQMLRVFKTVTDRKRRKVLIEMVASASHSSHSLG